MPIIWCIAIIGDLVDLVDGLRMKPVAITEEFIVRKNAQILKNVKSGIIGGLVAIVILSLIFFFADKTMHWGVVFLLLAGLFIVWPIYMVLISLGSDLPPKDDEESEEK